MSGISPGAQTPAFLTEAAGALPSRTMAVLEAIKRAILAGELKPGHPLVETDLAERLGVSKTPVREALKTLAGAGLVTMSPYKGATVRVVDNDEARHLYDVRLLLEPEALSRSVKAGRDWQQARAALTRASKAKDLVERNLANREFHAELYAGCGNPLLISMLADLRDQTALVSAISWGAVPWAASRAASRAASLRQPPSWEGEAAEHLAILEAAEAQDASRAANLLRTHITSFTQRNFPLENST